MDRDMLLELLEELRKLGDEGSVTFTLEEDNRVMIRAECRRNGELYVVTYLLSNYRGLSDSTVGEIIKEYILTTLMLLQQDRSQGTEFH